MFNRGAVQLQPGQANHLEQAGVLRKAMKGAGTDEHAIIHVASTHNFIDRFKIAEAFQASFGMSLDDELRKELSMNLEKTMRGLFVNKYHFWAQQVEKAIKGAGTDEKRLIQLVLLMSDYDYPLVSEAFRFLYNKDMFSEICGDISNNDWGRLLKAWMKGNNVSVMQPEAAADALYKAAKGAGTDEDVFISIMSNMTHENYRIVDAVYLQKYQKPLRKTIEQEFSGKSEFAYLLCHDYLLDPALAVASLIHKAVHGAGTDDESLINVTVLFADFFKGDAIKRAYLPFGDVKKDLKRDLSGKYEDAILAMWGL